VASTPPIPQTLWQTLAQVELATGSRLALPAPSLVGEMSWLSGQPTSARVSCRESCRIHRIPTEILWHWVQAHSEAGRTLLEALVNLASAHVALLQQ